MSDRAPVSPVANTTPPKPANQAREQVRHRVRGYKRFLTAAAFVGFSAFGVLISQPYLSAATTTTPTTQTTTSSTPTSSQSSSSSGSTYFTQQGSSGNSSSSTQTPVTSSHTS